MIQQNFISFKFAEEILRTIPGLFSAMVTQSVGALRVANVYIAPHFEIADRSLMDIDDHNFRLWREG